MSTDSRVAYALRAEVAETYLGGIVRAGDRDLNIAELLADGDGVIVVDSALEPLSVAVLDGYTALERVDVPVDAEVQAPSLETSTVVQLRARAGVEGLTGASSSTKPELVAALTYLANRRADGEDLAGSTVAEVLELLQERAGDDDTDTTPEA